jgi:hypothetical protein
MLGRRRMGGFCRDASSCTPARSTGVGGGCDAAAGANNDGEGCGSRPSPSSSSFRGSGTVEAMRAAGETGNLLYLFSYVFSVVDFGGW